MIQRNKGITLVELLMVIAIMLIVVGIAIPTVRTLTEADSVREATRRVNLFIEGERALAIERGYGGIWLERDPRIPTRVTRIFGIKEPDVYTGDFDDSEATVPNNIVANTFTVAIDPTKNLLFGDIQGNTGIQVNDLIQFGGAGPWYPIVAINNSGNPVQVTCRRHYGDFSGSPGGDNFSNLLPPTGGNHSYIVQRGPLRSSLSSVELPKGTFIDLTNSGFNVAINGGNHVGGNDFDVLNSTNPIVITFRNNGSLDRVYDGVGGAVFAPSNIFFLVAQDPQDLDSNHNNLDDLNNIWVSVSRAKGIVVSSQAASSIQGTNQPHRRLLSRRLVRNGHDLSSN